MIEPVFNRATHFSIVWAMVLAILTLVEWRGLDRDPMSEQIFLPFIERKITLSRPDANAADQPVMSEGGYSEKNARRNLQTEIEITFNGPLFLACFFVPILIFHSLGWLLARPGRGT